jgi:hypothetical protein
VGNQRDAAQVDVLLQAAGVQTRIQIATVIPVIAAVMEIRVQQIHVYQADLAVIQQSPVVLKPNIDALLPVAEQQSSMEQLLGAAVVGHVLMEHPALIQPIKPVLLLKHVQGVQAGALQAVHVLILEAAA